MATKKKTKLRSASGRTAAKRASAGTTAAKKTSRKHASTSKVGKKKSTLTRALQPMPADIQKRLVSQRLLAAYSARPPYQQNDYLAWIARAKRPETRQKRLDLMLHELERGDSYMAMAWPPRTKKTPVIPIV